MIGFTATKDEQILPTNVASLVLLTSLFIYEKPEALILLFFSFGSKKYICTSVLETIDI